MTSPAPVFAPRTDHDAIELGTGLAPHFDADGLIVAIATDADTNEVLMVAHMNAEALSRTIASREAWFYSRSRQKLWRKGEDSGNTLAVAEMRVDCDQDVILVKVRVAGQGVTCHQGYRSCFYRSIPTGKVPDRDLALVFDDRMLRVKRDVR